jgi:tRNA1Val (adenine37-N6)-methyltransferase
MKVHHCAIQKFEPGYHYDVVISNPPFYEQSLRSPDSKKNVAMHSTRLDATELFDAAKRLMAKGGRMALLIPYNRIDAIERIIKDNALYVEKRCW